MSSSPLAGRRVVITGASRGIGAATAQSIVSAGGRVALLARDKEQLRRLTADLGPAAFAVPCDVTADVDVQRAVEEAAEQFDGLDAVVNNAGMVRPGLVADTNREDWRRMFDVNVLGLLSVTQAALPYLRQAPIGDIVNVSSLSGRRVARPDLAVYAATKHAVHALSDGLRRELREDRIRVSVVSPGLVRTAIFDDLEPDPMGAELQGMMHDLGLPPASVGNAIVHVLAQPADVVTAEVAVLSVTS